MKFGPNQRQRLLQITHWRADYKKFCRIAEAATKTGPASSSARARLQTAAEICSRVFDRPLSKIVHGLYSTDDAIIRHITGQGKEESEAHAADRFWQQFENSL